MSYARFVAEELLEAMGMVRCPYYQRDQKCDRGCYSEPECVTCQPLEGWEERIRSLRRELTASAPQRSDSDRP